MATFSVGDVVVADFPGIMGVKRRPAVVLSGDRYHHQRPDMILGAITTNLAVATTHFDAPLQDWRSEGLRHPSAFRTFLVTVPRTQVLGRIGHLSEADWQAVVTCLRLAMPGSL